MNFILEQLVYLIILFISNPCTFFSILKNIETLPFGREVRKIIIKDNTIYKYYRNRQVYQKTINYYHIMKKFNFIPRNLSYDKNNFLIVQEFKGRLLQKKDLNYYINKQLLKIFKQLKKNNIIIQDIKPLFFNNKIINNVSIINGKLYIIDYGDMIISSSDESIKFYNNIILNLKLYNV